jgi:hypothetical protein
LAKVKNALVSVVAVVVVGVVAVDGAVGIVDG